MPKSRSGSQSASMKFFRSADLENWSNIFVVEDYGSRILQKLDEQRQKEPKLCDMKLVSTFDDVEFPCHRAILADQSEFIANFFKNNELAYGEYVEIPQYSDTIRDLLSFIYSGSIEIEESQCWRLYSTVCFFKMTSTALQDEIFGVLLKMLADPDKDFFNSADFLNVSLTDMPRVFDVLMKGAATLGQSTQLRLLEALGKWANIDFIRRGQLFLEIDHKYQLSIDLGAS